MLTDKRSSPAEYEHLSDTSLYTLEIGAARFAPLRKLLRNHRSYVWSEALSAAWFSFRRKSYPAYSLRASSPIWASEASLARKRERGPSRLRRSLARSRETRFASPNSRVVTWYIQDPLIPIFLPLFWSLSPIFPQNFDPWALIKKLIPSMFLHKILT